QPLLERAHLLTDGRLRHVQFARGAREAQMSRRRFEGAQGVQRQMPNHAPKPIRNSNASEKLSSFVPLGEKRDIHRSFNGANEMQRRRFLGTATGGIIAGLSAPVWAGSAPKAHGGEHPIPGHSNAQSPQAAQRSRAIES